MANTIKTKRGQDIFDICLQNCGQLSNLFDVLGANPSLQIATEPPTLTAVTIPSGLIVEDKVVSFFKTKDFTPNNASPKNTIEVLLNENDVILLNENGQPLLINS